MDSQGLEILDRLPLKVFAPALESSGRVGDATTGSSFPVSYFQWNGIQHHQHDSNVQGNSSTNIVNNTGAVMQQRKELMYLSGECLASGLQLASHLARNSEKYYPLLFSVFTAEKLVLMLLQVSFLVLFSFSFASPFFHFRPNVTFSLDLLLVFYSLL